MYRKPKDSEVYDFECATDFCVDYDPLEYLLISLIDAHKSSKKGRKNRLRDAYQNIVGVRRERVDEPDSDIAKAMFEYFRLESENYTNQLKPEHGGPVVETPEDEMRYHEKTSHGLSTEAATQFEDERGNRLEYIYRRASGTYNNKKIRNDPEAYRYALRARFRLYSKSKEKELFDDLSKVAKILERHGISMNLSRAFWRITD